MPQLASDTRQQLGNTERLDQVIVRSSLETADDVVLVAQAGEHEDGTVEPLPAQGGAELAPIAVRQPDIEPAGVEALAMPGHQGLRLADAGSDLCGVTSFSRQSFNHHLRDFDVIFNNQDG